MNGIFDLSWIVQYICEYIQNDADMSLVDALENSLPKKACGSEPLSDCKIFLDLQLQFNRYVSNFETNRDWQNTIGSQIILWLRNH